MLGVAGLAACGQSSSAPGAAGALSATTGPSAPSRPEAPRRSPAATTSSPGATLFTASNDGATAVISSRQGDGFTVLYDSSSLLDTSPDGYTLENYDAAGNQLPSLPAGQFSGGCGAADVVNSAGRLVITLRITVMPAQGIVQASSSLTMTAWNAATGARVWTSTLVKSTTQQIPCPSSDHELAGDLWNFVSTLDGHWGVFVLPDADASVDPAILADAIDLTTGKLYPIPDLEGILGNNVVTGGGSGTDDGPVTLTVTTPGAWVPLGRAGGSGAGPDAAGLLLAGQASVQNGPYNYAPTGYTGTYASFDSDDPAGPGNGIGAVATPDGRYLITVNSGSGGNFSYGGYSLPSLHQVWSAPDPDFGNNDQIAGVSDTALLITRVGNDGDTYLLSLDPATGQEQWKIDIGPGGSVCDLTSMQVLALANSQLAILSAATGRQLSYATDPYRDSSGGDACPAVIETGLGGTGFNNDQVTQLLKP